jgi:hypothetical protein
MVDDHALNQRQQQPVLLDEAVQHIDDRGQFLGRVTAQGFLTLDVAVQQGQTSSSFC